MLLMRCSHCVSGLLLGYAAAGARAADSGAAEGRLQQLWSLEGTGGMGSTSGAGGRGSGGRPPLEQVLAEQQEQDAAGAMRWPVAGCGGARTALPGVASRLRLAGCSWRVGGVASRCSGASATATGAGLQTGAGGGGGEPLLQGARGSATLMDRT